MIYLVKIADVMINSDSIITRMRLSEEEDLIRIKQLCDEAVKIAKPKFIYKVAYINNREGNCIIIDNTKFTSKLMCKNFQDISRVFPYIATCGREVYEWANKIEDVFEKYWVDYIMECILRNCVKELYKTIEKQYGIAKISSMNPGSLEGWPINQQKELFELLEDPYEKIGVELKESFLMIPHKSVSGILFPSKSEYVNCKLCDRENCQSRREKFDIEIKKELLGEV